MLLIGFAEEHHVRLERAAAAGARRDVEARHVESGVREFDRERKTDVTETNDADARLGGADAFEKLCGGCQWTIASPPRLARRR